MNADRVLDHAMVTAYNQGKSKAISDFVKVSAVAPSASAKDAVQIAEMIGNMIGKGFGTARKAGDALMEGATNATLLGGLLRDSPRAGLVVGTGMAGAGLAATTLGDAIKDDLIRDLVQKGVGPLGMLGGTALAVGSNPGIVGGSALGRVSREIAAEGTTPTGLLGITAGLVGLPAALIGYGRMKERSENSLF